MAGKTNPNHKKYLDSHETCFHQCFMLQNLLPFHDLLFLNQLHHFGPDSIFFRYAEKLVRGYVYDLVHKREAQETWQGHLVLVSVTLLKTPPNLPSQSLAQG